MNYFPGHPIKRPKQKEVESSVTEGTQRSSMQYGSIVTPNFHMPSDDDEFFETPRRTRPQKNQPSTQEFMQQIIDQNQKGMANNGFYGSSFSFAARDQRQGGNDLFGIPFADNQYNQFQYNFASDGGFSFNGEKEFGNQNIFGDPSNNWSNTMSIKAQNHGEKREHFGQQENLTFHEKIQESEKRSIFNPMKRQSRIEQFQKNNGLTIFQVRQQFEGLTNPIDDASQSNSQNVKKTNGHHEIEKYQSNKKSQAENEKLRQSIMEVLSSMGSSESDSRKQIIREKSLGIKEKYEDEEDKDTIIDDLSDLVLSPPKYEKLTQFERSVAKPFAGSQRKGELQIQFQQFGHKNSTKTLFQLRNKNKQSVPVVFKKVEEAEKAPVKRQSFLKRKIDQNTSNKQKCFKDDNEDGFSNGMSSNFIESRVAQINLDSLQSLGFDLLPIKNNNQLVRKPENRKSFFKSKPFDLLNERNQRKNNLMKKQEPEQKKQQEQKVQKSQKRSIFSGFGSTRHKKSKEIQSMDCFNSNPLPIDNNDQGQNSYFYTKPFEYHSEAIDQYSQFQTKPINFEKKQSSVSKFGMFGKRNRNLDTKGLEGEVKTEKKMFQDKEKTTNLQINDPQKVKIQPELKRIEQKTVSNKGDEDKVSMKSNKINFMRRNSDHIIQPTKTETKQETKIVNNMSEQNIIQNKPRQRGLFKFERRKDHKSKESKVSINSMNSMRSIGSESSDVGPDMKGIFQKVNEQKQNVRKNNFKENNTVHQQKQKKFNFDLKHRNRIQGLKLSNPEEEKKEIISSKRQPKKIEKQVKEQKKSRFSSFNRNSSYLKHEDNLLNKEQSQQDLDFNRNLTVEKEKPRQNSTIPKYIFSKKTPPKNSSKNVQEVEKKDSSIFNNFKRSGEKEEKEEKPEKPKHMFESRKKFSVEQVTRSNYMIQKERQGFKEETESQKMKYRNRRSDSSDFPSISSNSTRSDLIREVENLIVLAGEAKIRMRKKKEDSEEFLQKTIDLKKRVDELFPDERIKKLMEWKYL